MRFLVIALLLATAASAQDGRLVLREAVSGPPPAREVDSRTGIVIERVSPSAPEPDTTGLERALTPEGETVWLGAELADWTDGAVVGVGADVDPYTQGPQLSIVLGDSAAAAFSRISDERRGESIAIVLDGRVLTAPTINERIPNGRVMIAGAFTRDEVEAIVAEIRAVTGAADARAQELAAVRAAVDRSTPEAAAETFVAAMRAKDWLTVARSAHPEALVEMRESYAEALILDGDVVTAEGVGQVVSAEAVLGRRASSVDGYDDAEVVALGFALTGPFLLFLGAPRIVGVVSDGPDRAFVVLAPGSSRFGMEGSTSATLLSLERVEGEWALLFPL